LQNLKAMFIHFIMHIGKYCIAIALAIIGVLAYAFLQIMLFGRGDYLLFVSNGINIVAAIFVLLPIVYVSITVMGKFEKADEKQFDDAMCCGNDEYDDGDELELQDESDYPVVNNRSKKILKICYIPVLLISIYWGITNYAILYTDTIKVCSPLNPSGTVYGYKDVESISVGFEEYRKTYSPVYEVKFYDGTSINLFGGSIHENLDGEDFEDILIKFDERIMAQGVRKSIDRTHFSEYSKDLNREFAGKVRKLFD